MEEKPSWLVFIASQGGNTCVRTVCGEHHISHICWIILLSMYECHHIRLYMIIYYFGFWCSVDVLGESYFRFKLGLRRLSFLAFIFTIRSSYFLYHLSSFLSYYSSVVFPLLLVFPFSISTMKSQRAGQGSLVVTGGRWTKNSFLKRCYIFNPTGIWTQSDSVQCILNNRIKLTRI